MVISGCRCVKCGGPAFGRACCFFLSTSILVGGWGDVRQVSFGWKCVIWSGLRVMVQVLGLDRFSGTEGFGVGVGLLRMTAGTGDDKCKSRSSRCAEG